MRPCLNGLVGKDGETHVLLHLKLPLQEQSLKAPQKKQLLARITTPIQAQEALALSMALQGADQLARSGQQVWEVASLDAVGGMLHHDM